MGIRWDHNLTNVDNIFVRWSSQQQVVNNPPRLPPTEFGSLTRGGPYDVTGGSSCHGSSSPLSLASAQRSHQLRWQSPEGVQCSSRCEHWTHSFHSATCSCSVTPRMLCGASWAGGCSIRGRGLGPFRRLLSTTSQRAVQSGQGHYAEMLQLPQHAPRRLDTVAAARRLPAEVLADRVAELVAAQLRGPPVGLLYGGDLQGG